MEQDAMINSTRRDLDEALQKHIAALYGANISVDWIVMAETVDAEDDRNLVVAMSSTMSAWKCRGMAYHGSKLVHSLLS